MQWHTHTHTHKERKSEGSTKMAKIGKYYSRTEARWVPMAWVSHITHKIIFTALQNTEPPRSLSSPWPYCLTGTSAKLQEPLGFLANLGSLNSTRLNNRQKFFSDLTSLDPNSWTGSKCSQCPRDKTKIV